LEFLLLEPGQTFAHRYRVKRRIAEGGMGAIFEAEHTATERRVALKLLFPHIMSVASARKKFELEAKISARVNSPNIVEVLDAGFDDATQSPYLVMELLDGQTLAQYVREQGPLGIEQALPLLEQIAAGLDAAHGYREPSGTPKPIVHRDLKPENLFMARERGAFMIKILDFGIAKVLGETGNISQEVRGTPLYMAFEQVTAGPLSPQTDVWAFGLIAYYMFTGSHYWRSASEPSANVQSLFAEILSLPLEAPSVRLRQQQLSIPLPAAFDPWLLECIQRDPSRRFASTGVAVAALERAFEKSPRARARVDSKPAPATLFAETQAYEPPTATSQEQTTGSSVPAMASERGPSLAPSRLLQRTPWLGVGAGAGALLLASVGWLVLSPGNSPSAASDAAIPVAVSAAPGVEHAARSDAPVTTAAASPPPSTLTPRSAPETAVEPKAPVEVASESGPEPHVRIAPREAPAGDVAPGGAPAVDARRPWPTSPAPSTNAGTEPSAQTPAPMSPARAAADSSPSAQSPSPGAIAVSPATDTSPAAKAVGQKTAPPPPKAETVPPKTETVPTKAETASPKAAAAPPPAPAAKPTTPAPGDGPIKIKPKNVDAYRTR
jgi:eukaryotic-like serine/threonine-protein kinase